MYLNFVHVLLSTSIFINIFGNLYSKNCFCVEKDQLTIQNGKEMACISVDKINERINYTEHKLKRHKREMYHKMFRNRTEGKRMVSKNKFVVPKEQLTSMGNIGDKVTPMVSKELNLLTEINDSTNNSIVPIQEETSGGIGSSKSIHMFISPDVSDSDHSNCGSSPQKPCR